MGRKSVRSRDSKLHSPMQSGSLEDQIIKAVGILHGALLTRCLPYHNPAYAILSGQPFSNFEETDTAPIHIDTEPVGLTELYWRFVEQAASTSNQRFRHNPPILGFKKFSLAKILREKWLAEFTERTTLGDLGLIVEKEGLVNPKRFVRANQRGDVHARVWAEHLLPYYRTMGYDLSTFISSQYSNTSEFMNVLKAVYILRLSTPTDIIDYFGIKRKRDRDNARIRISNHLDKLKGAGYLNVSKAEKGGLPSTFKLNAKSHLAEGIYTRMLYPLLEYSKRAERILQLDADESVKLSKLQGVKQKLENGELDCNYQRVLVLRGDSNGLTRAIVQNADEWSGFDLYVTQGSLENPQVDSCPHIAILDLRKSGGRTRGCVKSYARVGTKEPLYFKLIKTLPSNTKVIGIFDESGLAYAAKDRHRIYGVFEDPRSLGGSDLPANLIPALDHAATAGKGVAPKVFC